MAFDWPSRGGLLVHGLAVPLTILGLGAMAGGVEALSLAGTAALLSAASAAWAMYRYDREQQTRQLRDAELLQTRRLAGLADISAGIAHEINTPLGIILQEAELLADSLHEAQARERDQPLAAELLPGVAEIVAQVSRCREITHALLSLSRQHRPIAQLANPRVIADEMIRLLEKEAAAAGVRIVRHYAEAVPRLRTDTPLLRQVVLNLLTNALQALQGQGAAAMDARTAKEIGLHIAPDDDGVRIEVHDNGPGIPPQLLPRIFDPFVTTKAPGVGSGLGLTICQRIVRELGGRLSAHSRPGHTVFTIALPLEIPPP